MPDSDWKKTNGCILSVWWLNVGGAISFFGVFLPLTILGPFFTFAAAATALVSSSAWLSTLSSDELSVVYSGSHSGLSWTVGFSSTGTGDEGAGDGRPQQLDDPEAGVLAGDDPLPRGEEVGLVAGQGRDGLPQEERPDEADQRDHRHTRAGRSTAEEAVTETARAGPVAGQRRAATWAGGLVCDRHTGYGQREA